MINLGWYNKVEKKDVLDAISRINDLKAREKMSALAIKQINKNGVEKLCSEIQKIL